MPGVVRWRRFKPRVVVRNDGQELYEMARTEIERALPHTKRLQWHDTRWIDNAIDRSKTKVEQLAENQRDIPTAASWMALAIMQSPRAARAQIMMDKHKHGYKDREKRLFELIDFNDAFVSCVLSLPEEYLEEFTLRFEHEIDLFCRKLHVAAFTHDQYEAITHGLSREIAVFRGAIAEGLKAKMTSRVQDAMGVDMIITDPYSNRSINIDCKTHSSFHFRLVDLNRQGRIDEQKRMYCELAGYCVVINKTTPVVLVRVSTDHLGEIENYTFKDTSRLGILLRSALHDHGK